MDLLRLIVLDLPTYHWWWVIFVFVSFLLPRLLGWPGVVCAHLLLALLIFFLDRAALAAARAEPDSSPMDVPDLIIWVMGAGGRIIFINVVLLPVAWLACVHRRRTTERRVVAPN